MSTFSVKIKPLKGVHKEKIKISPNSIHGVFLNFTGKSGDHWISIIPSLNISGYGNTENEAIQDLEYNVEVFSKDLFKLDHLQRVKELKKLGWTKHKYLKKQYSSSFVDENGVLQNFDFPEQVKKTILEAA
jgi:hypothetical protein